MRILVVENNTDTLRWLAMHLEDLGHTVVTAQNSREGEALLNSGDCDVLISDVRLADGSGLEMLERAHVPRPMVTIAMSGAGRNIDSARSFAAGYQHHLYKPFRLEELERLLQQAA